jgi:4'-phosphopantetheinyl transferase
MNTPFSIKNREVHLWRVYLPQFLEKSDEFLSILNPDEIKRANRFHFERHRNRFIITRYLLRHTLSLYINISPEKIEFSYGQHGKPYFDPNPNNIYFNASHSHDIAIFGLTRHTEIGVDIERVESECKMNVAKHFFSNDEYSSLLTLPQDKKNSAFYAIWARKESVLKALGKGLSMPLNSFSTVKQADSDYISFRDTNKTYHLLVEDFSVHAEYQAAFAVEPPIADIFFWEWKDKSPVVWR